MTIDSPITEDDKGTAFELRFPEVLPRRRVTSSSAHGGGNVGEGA